MDNNQEYTLHFLYYGYEETSRSHELKEMTYKAKELILLNKGKPIIITNKDGEIVREYTPRKFNPDDANYAHNFKSYEASLQEISLLPTRRLKVEKYRQVSFDDDDNEIIVSDLLGDVQLKFSFTSEKLIITQDELKELIHVLQEFVEEEK